MMIHYNSACPWSHAPPIAVSFCNREFYPKQLTDSALCVKRGIQEVLIHDLKSNKLFSVTPKRIPSNRSFQPIFEIFSF